MTNHSSNANHTAMRRCVICKNKKDKESLFRIVFVNNQIIIDLNASIKSYGYYICGLDDCLKKMMIWKNKKKIKGFKV